MRILALAYKDILQLLRDWKSAVFLAGMPIVFTLIFGLAFGGFGTARDTRLPVGLVDRDGSALSAELEALLASSAVVRPVVLGDERLEIERQVREELVAAALIVPAGYGERSRAGESTALELIVDPAALAGQTAQGEVGRLVQQAAGAVQAAQLATAAYDGLAGFAGAEERAAYFDEARQRALAAWADPPLEVTVRAGGPEEPEEGTAGANAFTHSSPSMMVQFGIAGVMGAAEILLLERKSRTLRRQLTTAVARAEIILGHYLAMLAMTLLQLLMLAAFAQAALRVDYLRTPLAALLMVLALALFVSSLGLLIGTLSRSAEQVIMFTIVAMMVLGALGGAWMPLEGTGAAFQTVGHLLPAAWAMDGLENLVVRGLGPETALLPAGVLVAYAAALFGLALWRFRFEE